jgi:hypothetical protein
MDGMQFPEAGSSLVSITAFSNLKSWLKRCHHGVSPQHLQANSFKYCRV